MLLNSFITHTHLVDLEFIGLDSWCNGRFGLSQRWAKLNKILANTELEPCNGRFDSYSNKHLVTTLSEHAMLFLNAILFTYA